MSWKKLSTKQVYKNQWMEVTEDQVKTDSGKQLTFGVVRKDPFTLIIPWDGKRFVLVGQYRYAVTSFSWEFPKGHLEHDTIYETAERELEEETGLKAGKITELGSFYLAPGHHTQVCHVFFATKLSKGKIERDESEEGMKIKRVTPEKFQAMITKEEIKDGPTTAAFTILKLKNLL